MDNMENNSNQETSEQFDLVWLISYLFTKRKAIIAGVAVTLALAMLSFLVKPKVFTSSCVILPNDNSAGGMKGLSGLANMAGVNLGSQSSSSGTVVITPDLYPMVSTSTPMLLELINVPLDWEEKDEPMTAYEYFYADTIMTFGKWIKKYTIGLPWTIKNAIAPPPPSLPYIAGNEGDDQDKITPIQLDKVRLDAIKWALDKISVVYDDEVEVINISVSGETADQSATLAAALLEQLQKTITAYKTKRAKTVLKFMQNRYDETLRDYEKSRSDYLAYRDHHRDIVEERTDATRQKLEDKYNLDYSLLSSLQSQVESARMQLVDDTPVFAIVEPVVKPDKKSSPKFLHHAVGGVALGLFVMIAWYLARMSYFQVFNPKKYKEIKDSVVKPHE